MNHQPEPQPPASSGAESPAELPLSKLPKIVRFADLVVCGDELWIENNGELYRLRRTRLGKLILTK
jgi:hemin uptake protein HemP